MTTLVEIKQLIKAIYIRYEMWITPLWKFLLSFIALLAINSHVGYLSAIKPLPITLMLALLCSFMPVNFMVFVVGFVVLGHLYAVSIETLGVSLVLFLLMFLLYFRFGPGDTVVLILTPLLFLMKIPYLMPIALGLVGSPVSVAAMSCGVVVYYLLSYVQTNATTMGASSVASGEDSEIIVQLRTFLTGFLTNRAMWTMIIAFAVVLIVVYLIRRLAVDHSWKIAILAGAVINVVTLLIGDFLYDTQISFIAVVVGTLFSALLAFGLEFFFFHLDYTRTERVQFEDDDYYYYVKAIPKVTLAEPERRIKKINRTYSAADGEGERQKPAASKAGRGGKAGGTRRMPRPVSAGKDSTKSPSKPGAASAARTGLDRAAEASARTSTAARAAAARRTAPAARTGAAGAGTVSDDEMADRVFRVGNNQTTEHH